MVVPRYDGAPIPGGSFNDPRAGLGGGPTAPAGVPAPRFATRYLQNIADRGYRSQTQAFLGSGGKSGRGYVFTGTRFNDGGPFNHHPGIYRDDAESNKQRVETKHRDIKNMMGEFDYFSTEKKKTLAKQLFMAGFLSKPDANLMDLQEAYGNLLSSASARYAQGQQISPRRLLENNIRYNLAAAGVHVKGKFSDKASNSWFQKLLSSEEGGSSSLGKSAGAAAKREPELDLSGTFTSKSRNVDIWSPTDARGLIRATLRRELDRDPTEAEFEEFVSTLQAAQRRHPAVTTTTVTRNKEGEVTNQNSVTRGGLGASGIQEIAQREAEENPHWAEWQAVGTYFPALLDALGSAVPGT